MMSRRNNSDNETRYRIPLFIIFVLFSAVFIGYKLFGLTVRQHNDFVRAAQSQYVNPSQLLAGRGTIYMSDALTGQKTVFSTNKDSWYVYSNNKELVVKPKDITTLEEILEIENEQSHEEQEDEEATISSLQEKLSQDTSYIVLQRGLTEEQKDAIDDLDIQGLTVATETVRYYPDSELASHVAGFVGFEGKYRVGQYGIESSHDTFLSGAQNTQRVLGNNTYGRIAGLFKGEDVVVDAAASQRRGDDIVLTIDPQIQEFIELTLDDLVEQWSPESGTIIIQDPRTGAILAMASYPNYDPNNYAAYEFERFLNPATQQIFEPGSTFKPITMAAALDAKVITPDTTYNDTGSIEIGKYTVSNFDKQGRGIQTMRQVLMRSLNTGTIFAQRKVGNDRFLNYVVGFGFGESTGIDLPGELEGTINNLYTDHEVNHATASFGQGIAVTPVQMVNAYATIANGGKRMKPYVVKEIIHTDGTRSVAQPELIDAPIRDTTARQLTSMLVSTANHYTQVNIEDYDVAAKTGTAQIPNDKGGYNEDEVIHNFAGFAPAYDARFVVYIKLDRPTDVKYAVTSLSGAYVDITRFLLNYFSIPPQDS